MLALGVKRFTCNGVEVEFHDAAVAQALSPQAEPEPYDEVSEARKRDKADQDHAEEQVKLLFRGMG